MALPLSILQTITWDVNPELINLFGILSIRWYSMLFILGLGVAYFVVKWFYKDKGIPDAKFEPLFFYCFFGIFIGARLGHCLLYDPSYYLAHPLEIILPFREINGVYKFTGYQGLASHGGVIGIMTSLYLYARKVKLNVMDVFDNLSFVAPITAGFIRLANLSNSEIIGKATDVPWAFVFVKEDLLPRHPAQLYEAIAYFTIFAINLFCYLKFKEKLHRGFFFGLIMVLIFGFRFCIEFLKERQVAFEEVLPLDMGQLLSIPFVLVGFWVLFNGKKLDAWKW